MIPNPSPQVKTLNGDTKLTTVALVNKQMIINLASADFLMGVYLISLGIMDELQVIADPVLGEP